MQTETVGARIRYLRRKNGITQKKLAEILYVSVSTVSCWERDRSEPSICFIVKLTMLFCISLDYLMTGNEKTTP
ncbi:MAG: helix-turn-helix domain-containing protein [Oscillospiraceae bacterium]|nr:helix-turn-helix domain-containing protein [Oscillospiraceae bacterium]